MPAIETRSLTKQYGSLHAVRDVDLVVERGEVFGFLGPNGAGKSTTIDVLLDLVRPTSGSVSVLGRDPQEEPRAVRERVGVLPEAFGYYGDATARDHVAFAVDMKRATADPSAVLERVGLADAADRRVEGFSKGMRQRLGLAMALVGDPDLLILDEPLAGLDPTGARLLRDVVRAERDRGVAVFLSSHIMDQVETLCDRVGIMNQGELVAVDDVERLRSTVARQSTFVVTVDAVPDDHGVANVDGVADVTARDGTLRVSCTDATAKAAVVRRLEAAGATVLDVCNESTPLEELFVALTGSNDETVDGPAVEERTVTMA
ncbi:ABC transporter ATP-binding protein [Halomicrococcus gelatinilyticus]|uniref:ABC transporter ATP-binding protein n=1 Tax=Halomicrococcus gelatinilyticus TaxID=1702103 RepID=UPI002E0E7E55